ncbi:winged helix-turn-helix domain-containing protein [Jeotgalibacillus proteolyticus]|uniref:OmpR/PhoB-type domain-containing protein n=1 Tax=Jeotgalibacillus proteolyticus TaxID=2082395 RepID=A0A2S5G7X2_9BACL|nr:winged helix-turn-helix domain-containing protein [Jeotgalibacillus proteolyticus]PPA69097.1 hypothetical protein C4B60_17440 [Jeotgalibacillus proteolyticus]
MAQLHFHLADYTVTWNGESIPLLRKEFYLLQYLYDHSPQAFSREQLLSAVWPMETPSDRTVDDHIYRLRKKLGSWFGTVKIETVKGYGYKLSYEKENHAPLPVIQDPEFQELLQQVLGKYHLYGQGEAVNAFLSKKEMGIEAPQGYEVILAYLRGDLWWFVEDQKLPMNEKLYFIIIIYQSLTRDYAKVISYFEQGIKQNAFSPKTHFEAKTLGLFFSYVFNKQFRRANDYYSQLTKDIAPEITDEEHGFYPYLMNVRLMLALCEKDQDEVDLLLIKMETFFERKPYQRELGVFNIIKGVNLLRNGENVKGREMIENGFSITKGTHFKGHLFLALDLTLFFLELDGTDPGLLKMIQERKNKLKLEYHPSELVKEIVKILDIHFI